MSMSRFLTVVTFGFFFVAGSASGQTILYVDDDNCPGPGSGTSGDPFCSLQDALDAVTTSCPDVTEIWVAEGTYKPSKETSWVFEPMRPGKRGSAARNDR